LEGQAVGRVVVTSNVYSMPEVAVDSAMLVDPENVDSIRKGFLDIIRDEGLRNEFVKRGKINIKRFDPEKIAKMYLELYKSIGDNAAI
jgi:glycosyltransferase involved in cell wall biosynthesis